MSCRKVHGVVWLLCLCVSFNGLTRAQDAPEEQALFRSYSVDKKVSDFPAVEDLSTPESAYATIMRDYMATGASGSEWSHVSVRKSGGTQRRPVSAEQAKVYFDARIHEVIVYKDRAALVIGEVNDRGGVGYDQRYLFLVEGRWFNSGHDGSAATAQAARDTFHRKAERLYGINLRDSGNAWNRPPVADPNAYLEPYIQFLREQGHEPHAFVMEAFKTHQLVVMGEVHNRPAYWAFNSALVRDPAFAQAVGTIYMEMPSNHQANIDRFLAQNTCEKELVVRMLRDFFELGWPCKPTLDFFVAVWEVNQSLPVDKKLRIRLVDMQRPWEKIEKRQDWRAYDVDRDEFMAKNILDDLKAKTDPRNGFFIVGMGHALEGFRGPDGKPQPSAGHHLSQALGDQLFTVFQHAPIITNQGETSGRLALGLIDSAFAALDDRPVAFTLEEGPFGKLPFDGMPDGYLSGTFDEGYDAYLYLVPLESEIFSPLIEGFYSEEFMPEIDRRWRLMNGKPLFSDIDVPTVERVVRMRAAFWGQPRSWVSSLGPENAWHYGDAWREKAAAMAAERHRNATREELIAELDKIYRGIKELDPNKYEWGSWERAYGFDYLTETNWPGMYQWWCDATKAHPFESVTYGPLTHNKDGLPQIEATTTFQGGVTFSKTFTFRYLVDAQRWQTQYGLDLHLDPQWRDLPKAGHDSSP